MRPVLGKTTAEFVTRGHILRKHNLPRQQSRSQLRFDPPRLSLSSANESPSQMQSVGCHDDGSCHDNRSIDLRTGQAHRSVTEYSLLSLHESRFFEYHCKSSVLRSHFSFCHAKSFLRSMSGVRVDRQTFDPSELSVQRHDHLLWCHSENSQHF